MNAEHHHEHREETKPSMKRRCTDHDYAGRCIYMITLEVEGRKPLLGRLCVENRQAQEKEVHAYVELSAIGRAVEECWKQIPALFPQVTLIEEQVMPDHFHGILFVEEEMAVPLGEVVRGFKIGCTKAYRELSAPHKSGAPRESGAPAYIPENRTGKGPENRTGKGPENKTRKGPENQTGKRPTPLWAAGYHDRILMGAGQLQTMIRYVKDNPHRLAEKRSHSTMFRIHRDVDVAGMQMDAVGNLELLKAGRFQQVHVRSRWTDEEKRSYKNQCVKAAREGAVLVSPFISRDEMAVRDVALQERHSMIVLMQEGFAERWKPAPMFFDAVKEGRCLLLAPWPFSTQKRELTREECVEMNEMAERIAKQSFAP